MAPFSAINSRVDRRVFVKEKARIAERENFEIKRHEIIPTTSQ